MKSMNNDDNNDNSWLGFSLSPHMNIEVSSNSTHHQNHEQSPSATTLVEAVPTSLFHATTHLNSNYGSYNFGNESTNGSLYSPLSMMPLKSDGSLCIMEALNRSHSQAITSPTPKLEDFFGSATMGTHQYENNGSREVMALSLDSMFYQQNQNHEPSNQSFLNHLQQTSRPQHFQGQQNLYYTGFRNNDMLIEEQAKETQHADCNFQLPTVVGDVSTWNKNLVSRSFSNTNAVEQKHSGCTVENGCEAYSNGAVVYGDIQSLNLSMSPGSQSSCVTMSQQILPTMTDCVALEVKKRGIEKSDQKQIVHRKSIDTFGQRTSQYRGVTRHRWTGRYEAHLWDNSYKKEGQSRKGRQVYLGGYDMEEKAARSYDLAALKYWGPSTHINFPLDNYQKELEEMKHMNRQEYVAHLRRRSSGFSRGASMYRGVTRHHQHGRWQARIGRVAGNKDLYLGTFSTQEEAAEAYDVAAIKFRGINAVTNFDISRYDVEKIMASNNLLSGELARRNKNIEPGIVTTNLDSSLDNNNAGSKAITQQNDNESNPDWKIAMYQSSQHPNHRTPGIDNYKSHTLKSSSDKRTEISAVSSVPQVAEKFTSIRTHLSNPESLVTSLSSSREGSPDRSSQAMPSELHPSGPTFLNNATSTGNSWIPAAQLRPALLLPTVPVFSTWTDG